MREVCSSLKQVLLDDMQRSGERCVPVMCDGTQLYARLKERRKTPSLSAEALVKVVRGMRPHDVASEATTLPGASLPEVIESWAKRTFRASGPSTTVVELGKKAERAYTPRLLERPCAPSIVQNAQQLHTETTRLRASQHADRESRRPAKDEQTHTREQVAQHLERVNPQGGVQRVRLQDADTGTCNEYLLVRKEVTRTRKPTARTAFLAVRSALERVCGRRHITHDASPGGLSQLQQPEALREFSTLLQAEFERMSQASTEVRVTMNRARTSAA